MAAYIAIGEAAQSYEVYMGCLVDGISKATDVLPVVPDQTEAPTEGSGGGVSGFAGSLILFQTAVGFSMLFG